MTLEICVDDIAGLDAAITGGADRIELCAALGLGGLTPSPSLIAAAASAPIPVHVLARPREGGFQYTPREIAMIAGDITAAADAGLAGVVVGASLADHRLDTDTLANLLAHARSASKARGAPLSLTLHRAIDLSPDLPAALDAAIALGFDRILTSGGAPKAIDGLDMLATLHRRSDGRIAILAGSGIDADNAPAFLDVGIVEIHASCSTVASISDAVADPHDLARERRFGFTSTSQRHTDVARVRRLKTVLTAMLHQAA